MRVGVFEPSLFSFSTHRAWLEGYWLTTRPLSDGPGDMGWTIEETQKGIELNGMARSGSDGVPASWKGSDRRIPTKTTISTPRTSSADCRSTVWWKGAAAEQATKPYIDNSLTIGAFGYWGKASLGPDPAGLTPDNKFGMVGGDVNVFYDRFNLFGGVSGPARRTTLSGGARPRHQFHRLVRRTRCDGVPLAAPGHPL